MLESTNLRVCTTICTLSHRRACSVTLSCTVFSSRDRAVGTRVCREHHIEINWNKSYATY
jgi:hypothetical protein